MKKSALIITTTIILTLFTFYLFTKVTTALNTFSSENIATHEGGHHDDHVDPPSVDQVGTGDPEALRDELEKVEERLEEVKSRKSQLISNINSEAAKRSEFGQEIANLSTEINVKQTNIEEISLEIEKLELEIKILEDEVERANKDIEEKEEVISELELVTSQRLVDMYLDVKSYSDTSIIFAPSQADKFVKQDLYKKSVQQETNSNLENLSEERLELEETKEQLNEDKIKVEKDNILLSEQKTALEREQSVLAQQRSVLDQKIQESLSLQQQQELALQQSSEKERELLAEQELLRQQLFNEINAIPDGTFVKKGTAIGVEGNTGWSTGPHLHFGLAINGQTVNPCEYLNCPSLSGSGDLAWPMSPQGTITSYFGPRAYDYHAAIDISTGGGASILAAHDGYVTYGKQSCYDLTWVKCNGGFAQYAIVCENKENCSAGYKTLYWHLVAR
jgi:murein DD-endopeptidase MepM/ murein hydrolase activator NlpD